MTLGQLLLSFCIIYRMLRLNRGLQRIPKCRISSNHLTDSSIILTDLIEPSLGVLFTRFNWYHYIFAFSNINFLVLKNEVPEIKIIENC